MLLELTNLKAKAVLLLVNLLGALAFHLRHCAMQVWEQEPFVLAQPELPR